MIKKSIAFITDNNYVMPTVVAIKSIEQTAFHFGSEYNIYPNLPEKLYTGWHKWLK